MRRTFRIYLAVGFLTVVTALIAVAGLSFRNARNLVAASVWVAHTDEVIAELERTRSTITKPETDPVEQSEYTVDSAGIAGHLTRLEQLTADNQRQMERVSEMKSTLADAAASDRDKRRKLLHILAQMSIEEQQLLADRSSRANYMSRATLQTIVLFSVVASLVCVLSYWGILRNLSAREKTEKALTESESLLRSLLEREQELSRVDPLTTVCNRRGFYEALDKERIRASRYRHSMTIAYVDIDNFKKVNDSLGHDVGDKLLVRVAAALRVNLRASDLVGRLGGDEFGIILPETDATGARAVLGKLRSLLLDEVKGSEPRVTFSIGGATFLDPPESLDIMIRLADETMYSIKAHGKNGVSVCLLG